MVLNSGGLVGLEGIGESVEHILIGSDSLDLSINKCFVSRSWSSKLSYVIKIDFNLQICGSKSPEAAGPFFHEV